MNFVVKNVNYEPSSLQKNTMFLIEDKWDDWFMYETMYDLEYVDKHGERNRIGKIKIAEKQMKSNQRRPNIPDEFEYLGDEFYSLGQSDYYYENLNKLGVTIREYVLESLNDIALDINLFEEVQNKPVTSNSLMRDISITTVSGQFNRIAKGGVRLTEYYFKYVSPNDEKSLSDPMELSFSVTPECLL